MTVFELVAALRAHGLTQAQIEERADVPQSTISKIERGKVDDVMAKTHLKLQALYDDISAQQAAQSN